MIGIDQRMLNVFLIDWNLTLIGFIIKVEWKEVPLYSHFGRKILTNGASTEDYACYLLSDTVRQW